MMERLADYVIRKINEAGAKHIFTVTGRGILYLTDAVAKNKEMTGISMLHEQGCSYAAMSYAKAREGVGACLVSTGCAATNAVTGCLCAYQDNLPIIFVSGQHMLKETTNYTKLPIRTYGSQEADIISVVKPIAKYAVMITDPQKIVYEVEKALHLANEGRKGPVWIDIPLDLQSARIEESEQEHYYPETIPVITKQEDIDFVVNKLNSSERPIIVLGGGASECKELIKDFVETNRIPVVYTFSACDIYGSSNECSIGAIGALGAPRAGCFAFQNADYILVIGSKMCSQTIGDKPDSIARDAQVTIIDIDEHEHKKDGIRYDELINSDAKEFIQELTKVNNIKNHEQWLIKCRHWKELFDISTESFIKPDEESGRIDLYDFATILSGLLNNDTAVITDAGLEELIIPSTIKYKDHQKCFFAAAQGAMGYAIPAIIGAYFGGYKNIVVVVGDGSIMMNIQELQLLDYLGIKPKIFVINNDLYAVIRARQKDLFRTRTIGNDSSDGVPTPDFYKLANAFDLVYFKSEKIDELERNIAKVLSNENACLCEVMCKTTQKYFHTSYRKNENGKLVRPSIEDMSPFMDRELFMNEMIVKPIEI